MTIRWGVVATGGIANRFAGAMTRVDDGEIVAVSSRTSEGAAAFADRWDIERGYSNEDEMAADPDIDVVYVATPHSRHETDTIRYLESGKPVLCEKPFALNSKQVRQMIATATSHRLFLMEAVWSRFLPAYRALTELVAAGRIGTPLQVDAEFGFPVPFDANHRLFAPELGGGALLDLGIYPLQLCTLILGPIDRVAAVASIGETGVDEQVAAVLHHERGGLGVAKASVSAVLSCTARHQRCRGPDRHPDVHALPEVVGRAQPRRRGGDRLRVRRRRPRVRDRRGASVHRGRPHRKPAHAPFGDARARRRHG